MNIELNFPPKLRGARSRLYRRRFLQVNTRWKALAEIYTMHSFAPFWNPLAKNGEKGPGQNNPEKKRKQENERPPFSNLKIFVKNRKFFFAIELMNIH